MECIYTIIKSKWIVPEYFRAIQTNFFYFFILQAKKCFCCCKKINEIKKKNDELNG